MTDLAWVPAPAGRPAGLSRLPFLVGALCLALLVSLVLPGVVDRRSGVVDPLLVEPVVVSAADQAAWLATGRISVVPELGDSTMVAQSLGDLHALSQPYGVPVASWVGPWRYVWPRDSALAAAALARTGHVGDAERILDFLQAAQPDSGVFQARYRPDGSGAPDARGEQLDGLGWALWSTAQVAAAVPVAQRAELVRRHRTLVDRSTRASLTLIDNRRSLPPVSADYWEKWEWRRTLATAALLDAGLQAAGDLYAVLGDDARAAEADRGSGRLRAAIHREFAPDGYPRHLGGSAGTVDLGVGFLLPPFSAQVDPGVVRAWRGAPEVMARPGGGLAPGGSWREDTMSWTTATSSYALTAAALGDRAEAVRWLRWLDAHRTASGSLPEKVSATGEPADIAPLTWTAAVVILTAVELDP